MLETFGPRERRIRARRAVASVTLVLAVIATMFAGVLPAQAAPPGEPTSVVATPGRRTIVVTWAAPDGGGVNNYVATLSPDGTPCTTTGLTCTITGLTAGTSYTVGVKACTASGTDCSAETVSSAVVPGPPGTPAAPTVEYNGTPDSVTVSWTAPTVTGDGIGRYIATATRTGTDVHSCVTTTGAVSCVITGLAALSDYQVTVVAVGRAASGTSAPSTPLAVRTRVVPGAPTAVTATPGPSSLTVGFVAGAAGPGWPASRPPPPPPPSASPPRPDPAPPSVRPRSPASSGH